MKRFNVLSPSAALLAATLLAASIAAAQAPPEEAPRATFSGEVEVSEVLLDVLVTDRQGNVVVGLGADDFQVTEDGRAVEVTAATFYSNRRFAGSVGETSGAPTPGVDLETEPRDRYFVLLFDDQRGHNADVPGLLRRQVTAGRDAAEWMRRALSPNDWVAVAAYDQRLRLQLDFSRDREAAARAVEAVTTGRGVGDNWPSRRSEDPDTPSLGRVLPAGDQLRDATGMIYDGLTLLAEASAPIRARKNLLLFTIGFGQMNRFREYEPDPRYYHPMAEALNDANVAVYTFDLTEPGTRHPFANAMHQISDETGGRYFSDLPSFGNALGQVVRLTSGYYLVSYRAEHLRGLRGFQRVEVKLVNPELRVTARRGYRFGD